MTDILSGWKCFNSCPREGAIFADVAVSGHIEGFNSCPREGAIEQEGYQNLQ